ncbi:MAG: membrane-bound lytic murein transglycosylase MltF [Halioglobus sp.]
MRQLMIKIVVALSYFSMGLLTAGCESGDALDRIKAEGELVIVTRNSPTTYYEDKNSPTGFEYALAKRLADELEVELVMKPEFSLGAIFRKLRRNEVDLAAAGLTLTGKRAEKYPHSQPYYALTPQVVYVAGTFRPRKLADLAGMSIAVLAGSSHADTLRNLQQTEQDQLQWRELEEADSMELLALVASKEVDLAIIDSNEFKVQQGLYPRLRVAFELGTEQHLAWFFPPDGNNKRLIQTIDTVFANLEKTGEMERLQELHFGHAAGVSRMGSHTFSRNVSRKLPKYRDLIQQVAQEYQLDWELLAAIAYQESHWNPQATSPTGVRGMMMLTLPTARELGVENRLDATQSLRGGARYLKNIKRRLPNDIAEPDLTWMGLAAYNIGMGHLEDARVITERHGGDPHLWADIMKYLPLLQKKKYYESVRHGFARGTEPVTYVQNIRHYYSVLQWEDISQNKPRPPVNTADLVPNTLRKGKFSAL